MANFVLYPYGEKMHGKLDVELIPGISLQAKSVMKRQAMTTPGARYYDSELGRWHTVDSLVSKYPGWSPYNYCLNNPLKYLDKKGETIENPYAEGTKERRLVELAIAMLKSTDEGLKLYNEMHSAEQVIIFGSTTTL